ncbi:right-handed parallel beta-helix repeat-containing protein [Streptacidiphilus sp. MAP5-52]|uniref:right-handed parallel beta-helix repeat-containing protein n=1 Tax=Streptacidiphilus sp. MAP5-52 TaxID=3156267 RepID=UPI003515B5DD
MSSTTRKPRALLALAAALTAVALPLTPAPAAAAATGTAYYVDCAATADGSGSQTAPFNTLADVDALTLQPGDSVLFDRGTTCLGSFTPHGSGTAAAPILVDAYGVGALPAIDANGAAQAVLLGGESYVQVRDLSLSAPGDNTTARRGVYVYAADAGTLPGIVLQDLDIHDVRGALPSKTTTGNGTGKYANASGGIVVEAQGSTTPTAFAGLQILDNRIHAVDREGIYTWSNWCQSSRLAAFWNTLCTAAWTPYTDLVVRGNLLWDIGGDGIAPMTGQNTLVDHNTLRGFHERSGSPNAGMWTANSVDATFQYNDTSGGHSTSDGMAYDVDHSTDGVVFQDNLSHDNQGGFFLLCPYNTPTSDFVIRDNISVNDSARGFQVCDGALKNGQIYGNTLYLADGVSQQIVTEATSATLDVKFTDNAVVRHGSTGTVGWTLSDPAWVNDHNLFYDVPVPSGATNSVTGAPLFNGRELADPYGFQLAAGSAALSAGVQVSGNGGLDYFGNPVPATGAVDIGAYQGGAVCAPPVAENFNTDPAGAAPTGWTGSGAAASALVGADPAAGEYGNSLLLAGQTTDSTITRSFASSSSDIRIDARLWAGQTTSPLGLHVLDTNGNPVAQFSLAADGNAAYTDNGTWTDSAFAYPSGIWLPVSLVLHPASGTYDIYVDNTELATARLTTGSGPAAQVRLRVQASSLAPAFAADDILVQPLSC